MITDRKMKPTMYSGMHFRMHNNKLNAVVRDSPWASSVFVDYEGYLHPGDKKSRIIGRKLIPIEDLKNPSLLRAELPQPKNASDKDT